MPTYVRVGTCSYLPTCLAYHSRRRGAHQPARSLPNRSPGAPQPQPIVAAGYGLVRHMRRSSTSTSTDTAGGHLLTCMPLQKHAAANPSLEDSLDPPLASHHQPLCPTVHANVESGLAHITRGNGGTNRDPRRLRSTNASGGGGCLRRQLQTPLGSLAGCVGLWTHVKLCAPCGCQPEPCKQRHSQSERDRASMPVCLLGTYYWAVGV